MPWAGSGSSCVPPRWPRLQAGNGTWCSQTISVVAGLGTECLGLSLRRSIAVAQDHARPEVDAVARLRNAARGALTHSFVPEVRINQAFLAVIHSIQEVRPRIGGDVAAPVVPVTC